MTHRSIDLVMVTVIMLLLIVGLLMVFSSSFVAAEQEFGDAFYYFKRQLVWAVLGLAGMFFLSQVQYRHWKPLAKILLIITLAMLVLVIIPGIGIHVGGSRRWLGAGPLRIQPSEAAKLGLVIFFSSYFASRSEEVRRFWPVAPVFAGVLGAAFILVMRQPDLGTGIAIAGTLTVMLFLAGARMRHLLLIGAAAVPPLVWLIFSKGYRMRRILAFINPEADPLDSGFNIIQSLYALGSGHLFGVGYGASRQKFFYLPEQHTDFIYSILGEELGFIGAGLVIVLFLLFAWRGYRVALSAPDAFGCLLAAGITTMIGLQAAINIAVATGSVPVTGIPLPLVSYGGSSLLFTLLGVGILLNISKYVNR